mmetsp:Transcript_32618/g.94443  ORF Transcript_32618/g.94443 Transcript_32618/m.94443 type:complete len:384 (-) Transcript_32618:413-1564(-)
MLGKSTRGCRVPRRWVVSISPPRHRGDTTDRTAKAVRALPLYLTHNTICFNVVSRGELLHHEVVVAVHHEPIIPAQFVKVCVVVNRAPSSAATTPLPLWVLRLPRIKGLRGTALSTAVGILRRARLAVLGCANDTRRWRRRGSAGRVLPMSLILLFMRRPNGPGGELVHGRHVAPEQDFSAFEHALLQCRQRPLESCEQLGCASVHDRSQWDILATSVAASGFFGGRGSQRDAAWTWPLDPADLGEFWAMLHFRVLHLGLELPGEREDSSYRIRWQDRAVKRAPNASVAPAFRVTTLSGIQQPLRDLGQAPHWVRDVAAMDIGSSQVYRTAVLQCYNPGSLAVPMRLDVPGKPCAVDPPANPIPCLKDADIRPGQGTLECGCS